MKVLIKGWIHRHQGAYDPEPSWMFLGWKSSSENAIPIREHEFEVEVPDGDMVAEQVQAIDAAILVERNRLNESIQGLLDRKAKLLCLTNDTPGDGLVDDDLPF